MSGYWRLLWITNRSHRAPPGPACCQFPWAGGPDLAPCACAGSTCRRRSLSNVPFSAGHTWPACPTLLVQGRLLLVPSGYAVSSLPKVAASSLPRQLLARARAQLALSQVLVNSFTPDLMPALVTAQKRVWWNMRQAELEIRITCQPEDEEKAMYTAALCELRRRKSWTLDSAKGI